jgi:hypothetical protein
MILKKVNKFKKKNFLNLIYKYYFYCSLIISFIGLFFFLNSGMWQMYKHKAYDRIEIYGIKNYLKLPQILYLSSKGFFTKTDKIYIDLNYKQIIKIEKNRSDKNEHQKGFRFPYENGGGFPFNYKWSKGTFRLNDNKKEKIEIRLKGARAIHWSEEKFSSYRVKVKNEGKVYGTDIFSLQKPRARNYLHEWIFHKLCKEFGLVALNYDFVNLIRNGEDKGLYVFEEGFSNELIERNNRRDGPIFSLDEKISVNYKKAELEVYDKKKWDHLALTKIAAKKIENLFSGKDNSLENIDIDLWAKYFAIIDLTQTFHGLLAKSVKFFYNPVSGIVEPIGFDGHYFPLSKIDGSKASNQGRYFDLLIEISNKNDNYQKNFINLFLKDKNFQNKYFFYLNEITKNSFLDSFFEKYDAQINKNLSLIYSDYYLNDHAFFYGPGIYYFDKNYYYKRANLIRKKIKIYKEKISVSVNKNKLKVKNYNLNKLIQPIKLDCLSKEIFFQRDAYLEGLMNEFTLNDLSDGCNKIQFKNPLTGKTFKTDLNFYINQDFDLKKLKDFSKNISKYFEVNDNKIHFKEKITKINDHIFIPANYTLHLKPGQEIILSNGSFIFSAANWIYKNNQEKIKIYSENDNNKGGGIFIFNNAKKTILNNIDYFNLGTLDRDSIKIASTKNLISNFNLLGSLNFYKTSVNISNSRFFDIYSEDAINIINSSFSLRNNEFRNIKYDAVDFDFTKGKLSNLNFDKIGNDAIDFSGSVVEADDIFGSNIQDKFISVGENSILTLNNSKLIKSNIGIASKDGSEVFAKNLHFDNVTYPFASYRKKNEFNGGKLEINNFKINNFKKKFLLDKNSIVSLDNKIQSDITKNLLKIIY